LKSLNQARVIYTISPASIILGSGYVSVAG